MSRAISALHFTNAAGWFAVGAGFAPMVFDTLFMLPTRLVHATSKEGISWATSSILSIRPFSSTDFPKALFGRG